MSDEIQPARSEDPPNAGNLPEGAAQQDEIRIDVYDADVIKDGRIALNFDPYMAQYIVTTDMDLLVVTAEGQTITLANYTDAVNSGFLDGIEVPGGGVFEADSILDIAQTVDDLTAALAEYETAAGESNLTQASGGFDGFSRLEIQSLGGLGVSDGEEGPVTGGTTQTDSLVSRFIPIEERSSIRFTEAEDIAGPVDLTASAPALILSGSTAGQEDGAIPLDIAAALTDRDGSETLTLTISGLPEGAVLSAGTVNPDGTVTITANDLSGLTVTPPSHSSDDFSLTVTATSTERASGATADVTDTIIVQVTGVANAPTLTVADTAGIEDTAISIDIEAALVDMDGSESLAIELSGIPDGAVLLSDGVPVSVVDGIAQLTSDQLDNLTISPPADSSADFQLTVSATATEADGDTSTSTSTIDVAVASAADAPTLTASDATARYGDAGADVMTGGDGDDVLSGAGGSDTISGGAGDDVLTGDGAANMPIAAVLDINAALGSDTDEVLSITVSGLPAGAALTAGVVNPDGSVTLTSEEANGVIITVAPGTPDFDLTVTATSNDADPDGGSSSVSESTVITVAVDETNIADADYLDGGAGADILLGGSGDDVLLGGTGDDTINTGAAGENGDYVEAGDGDDTVIYTVQDGVGMTQIDGGADFDTLQLNLTGIQFVDPDIQADLRALQTYLENGESGPIVLNALNLIAENLETVDLRVDGASVEFDLKADAASLTTENASGDENTAIALSLDAALTDTDGSETMSIELSGIPDGAVLKSGDDMIDVTDGTAVLTADQLAGLTITPAANDRSDFTLSATVTTTEALTGHSETVTGTIDVTVAGVANEASLVVSDASGDEDQAIDLSVAVGDIQTGDTASVTISGVPEGAILSAGAVNVDGSVTLTADDLAGLTITPAADSSDDFELTVTVTTRDDESGDTATTSGTITVSVAADADAPTLTVNDASGAEDQAIALDLSAALTDASENLSVTISDIPDGATLSAGTVNSDGSVTLTADQLAGLTITPAANDSSDFTLSVAATSTDGDDTATTTGSIAVSVAADADAPTLLVNDASGTEDQAIALDLSAALTDASESLSITISDIPDGATLSAGTVNPDGSVTLTADQLDGLTITPAANDSSDFTLAVSATSSDGDDTATTTGSIAVSVAADADAPTLTVNNASGAEDQAIALDLSAALTDASESLSVTISDIPAGATLSAGTVNPDGSVTLTADQLDGLTITPAANDSSDFTLAVSATSTDGDDTATTTGSIAVSVAADADAPTLTVNDASGTEDQAIALDLSAALTDASENLSVTISDIPAGAVLSAGTVNNDGSVTLTAGQLDGLTITPAANDSSDFTLAVSATSTDGDDTATTTGSIAVSVAADADAPTLSVTVGTPSLQTIEGSTTAVSIDSSNATDTGNGFTISTRTLDANGNLNDASTGNISINTNPPGFGVSGQASGNAKEIGFNNATGVSEQLIVDFAHDTTSVDVAFSWLSSSETAKYELYSNGVKVGEGTYTGITDAIDDAITLTATDGAAFDQIVFQGAGTEGDFLINSIEATIGEPGQTTVDIPLSISAALTDSSEALTSIEIASLPEGAVLTNAAGDTITITDGAASLDASQLAGLTLTVPQSSEGFDLRVTAGSVDGSDTATTVSTVSIDMPEASAPTLTVELGEGTVNHVDSGGPLGEIAIANANFEADTLDDGGFNYDLSGWVESGSGVAGAWDTTGYSGSYSQEEGAHEGEQAAWLQDAAISQTLNATFETDRLYTLNVDVGDSKMQDNVQYSIKVYAGDQLVGTVTEADFPTVNDAFTTATLVIDGSTFASDFSGFGENLRIELATTGDAQAHFDSVAMSAEAIPGAGPEASTTYPLDITASIAATDVDDTLSVSIGNIPDGTTLTNAAGDTLTPTNGTLTLTTDQLEGLNITVLNTHEMDIDLSVTATATDPTGLTAQTTSVVSLDIDPSSESGVDIAGTSGDDAITGSAGDDSLSGGDGDDTLIGGDGSDQISGGSGNDTIYGDRTDGSGSGTTQVTLLNASISSGSGNFSEGFSYADNVFGTNDSGSASGNYDSNDGADGGGALEINLGSLSDGDTTSGASGGWTTSISVANATTDAILTFSYRVNMSGSFESDEFAELRVALDGTLHGADGNDFITRITGDGDGGSDDDTGWQTVTLNLGNLAPGTHELTLGGFLNKATQNSEDLEINFDDISLVGTILGSDDTIDGGSGDDVIFADDGDDVIDGGDGTDTIDFSNADSGVTLDFANGTVTGGSDNDTISNVENAVGSDHADTMTGDENNNVLQGGGGDDTLDGGAGSDTVSYEDAAGGVTVDLANGTVTGADGNDIVSNFENVTGSAHADTIIGDSANNIINGGGGADNLTGGGGADTFKFSLLDGTADTITDFSIADGDKLDVSDLVNVEDNDAISNFVRITEDDSGNSIVQVDTSGSGEDGNFEDVAVLEGVTGLDINDVIDTGASNPDAV